MSMMRINDNEAAEIAKQTYYRELPKIEIEGVDNIVIYTVIETIEDKSAGLHGYVLENEITNETVISFEGTQTNYIVTQGAKIYLKDNNLFCV